MSLLKIIDIENGNRLFRWQHESGGCAFVEWKREKTLALELGYNDDLKHIHDDWERDAHMMLGILGRYRDRGVKKVDWKCRTNLNSEEIESVINNLDYELTCGWDVWVEDD
tara:strand:+ start:142 stop:474 length:333 start_codon:yes stop_codon:yes gene_type:complete